VSFGGARNRKQRRLDCGYSMRRRRLFLVEILAIAAEPAGPLALAGRRIPTHRLRSRLLQECDLLSTLQARPSAYVKASTQPVVFQ